jgi:hypothetical protein
MSVLGLDALDEIFNISVGRAAASLSELTREVVSMRVPLVHILSLQKAIDLLDTEHKLRITSVSQKFTGSFSGKALLMFTGSSSLEVVRLMLGLQMPLEQLTEMEQDAMSGSAISSSTPVSRPSPACSMKASTMSCRSFKSAPPSNCSTWTTITPRYSLCKSNLPSNNAILRAMWPL